MTYRNEQTRTLGIVPSRPRFDGEGEHEGINLDDPKVKEAILAAVTAETAGLKGNRDTLLEEKRKLKEQHDALQAQVSELGDLETVAAMVKRFQGDEESKLIAEGKIDEVLNSRTESLRKDAETRVGKATERVTELETQLQGAYIRIAELTVGAEVELAARVLECTATAMPDIKRRALDVFSLTEKNEPEARDANGTLLMGPDGKTPLSPAAWLEAQKAEAPHWWGASAGGGAPGGAGTRKGEHDAAKIEKMSPRQKLRAGMAKD